MNNICYSGGASGADTLWGANAKLAGHEVIHWGFQGMKCNWPIKSEIHTLTPLDLLQADGPLKQANQWLQRSYPTKSVYVNNLLRRNYWQIKNTERIYAVSYLTDRGMVGGGTGWAVTMGILATVTEAYVFDQADKKWYKCRGIDPDEEYVLEWKPYNPPKPFGKYTGIGSVEITEDGKQAITDLYV